MEGMRFSISLPRSIIHCPQGAGSATAGSIAVPMRHRVKASMGRGGPTRGGACPESGFPVNAASASHEALRGMRWNLPFPNRRREKNRTRALAAADTRSGPVPRARSGNRVSLHSTYEPRGRTQNLDAHEPSPFVLNDTMLHHHAGHPDQLTIPSPASHPAG